MGKKCKFQEYKCKDDGSRCGTKKYIDIQYEVYYVDPQKEWGVRPMSDIPGGSYLFEYAGELSIAKDQYENDDYIYSITSVCFIAFLKLKNGFK